MSLPFIPTHGTDRTFIAADPARSVTSKPSGSKRGRKPKNAGTVSAAASPRAPSQGPLPPDTQSTPASLQWTNMPTTNTTTSGAATTFNIPLHPATSASSPSELDSALPADAASTVVLSLPGEHAATSRSTPRQSPAARTPVPGAGGSAPVAGVPGVEEDVEGEDEMLPAMADDDYSAQLSFQSQSKDNLKVLMDNFSTAQYDRFEAYRRHALPKQAVRKVIQQTLGQQVSQPVAQVVAGFAKVFVGEIVEKARSVQQHRGDTGPLSPDHLREAYRLYQLETGRVGAARPLKSKRLFAK